MPFSPLELLQVGDSSVAVVTGLAAVAFGVVRLRKSSIANQYGHLPDAWTNEGDVSGNATGPFIRLVIQLKHGDLLGQLYTSDSSNLLYVNVNPAWPNARVSITNSFGKIPAQVAEASIRLHGNNNRLHWKLKSGRELSALPTETMLWPVPSEARDGE